MQMSIRTLTLIPTLTLTLTRGTMQMSMWASSCSLDMFIWSFSGRYATMPKVLPRGTMVA